MDHFEHNGNHSEWSDNHADRSTAAMHTSEFDTFNYTTYLHAESCGVEEVVHCTRKFCDCIGHYNGTPNAQEGAVSTARRVCPNAGSANCYRYHYCMRQKVLCLWDAARRYEAAVSNMVREQATLPSSHIHDEESEDGICHGLLKLNKHAAKVVASRNHYDSLLYTECVDYLLFTFRNGGGMMCLTNPVPMYVCAPNASFAVETRQINYVPIGNGSRRLAISITANYVGNFKKDLHTRTTGADASSLNDVGNRFSDNMHRCFQEAIGVDGEFTLILSDDQMVVEYTVGVGESDLWVGDLVTANALSLMVRNTSWMSAAQGVLDTHGENATRLMPPIVLYNVKFDPGTGHDKSQLCDSKCATVVSIVLASTGCVSLPFSVYSCGGVHSTRIFTRWVAVKRKCCKVGISTTSTASCKLQWCAAHKFQCTRDANTLAHCSSHR
ncbi:hypothetical protein ERJ75_001172900 [Trypanosoma vivax]|nr:hypothetical protein ERJ75_001172900 [Trypanosoma vivax]